jgi:type VI secretion system protein ImpC
VSRIVDQSDTRLGAASSRAWSHDLQRFLANVVAPYLIKIDTPRQAALIDAVDQALAEQLRAILHHPQFQQLEAAWRGLRWLVHTAETGTLLKLRLIQVTKDELKQDLAANPTRTESGLAHLLLDPASIPGTEPVALLLGTYEFTQASDDVALLRHLGMIAQQLRAPFVAAAGPRLVGCSSFAEIRSAKDVRRRFQDPSFREWHDLRRSPEAHWLALALPRFLLRLPYGTALEPVETFQFEELVTDDGHDRLLWGNPAFAVAAVAAGAFAREGWSIDLPRRVHRLEGLPLYIYEIEGTATTKPCAEVLLSERLVEALQEAGLVPVVSYRDSDMVALPCIQSLAEPRSLLP